MGLYLGEEGVMAEIPEGVPDDTIEFDLGNIPPSQYEETLFQDWRARRWPDAVDGATLYTLYDLFGAFQAGARSVLGLMP